MNAENPIYDSDFASDLASYLQQAERGLSVSGQSHSKLLAKRQDGQ